MSGAFGPKVVVAHLLDTLQHAGSLLQDAQEDGCRADGFLQRSSDAPRHLAKRSNLVECVLQAALVVAVKVFRGGHTLICRRRGEQDVVIDDGEKVDEELIHHLLHVQGLLARHAPQAAAQSEGMQILMNSISEINSLLITSECYRKAP